MPIHRLSLRTLLHRPLPASRLLPATLPRRTLATTTPPPPPRTLEKPTKFTPPSHPSRRPRPRTYPGPTLTSEDLKRHRTKKYPNMMPGEGTFMHYFLTSRGLHLYITLTTLVLLAIFTTHQSFSKTSPFAHLLPPASTLLSSPVKFFSTYVEVFKLHTAHQSAVTAERRKQKVEDVQKRSQYRKAHGLEGEGLGGWTAKTETEAMGPAVPLDGEGQGEGERRRRPQVKKWLGIW
ncbi:hypothetical protein FGG08_001793 [Glutinoglossum americanum]|uniref:Uncharacterized protein n=1 Tax=Glutinoglossum americanum TaxID=1670608 RepID=A0A9P8I650_9PEZI|nr:hypothetical protein FGG08_001793 [Glutinoglossum americanum]